MTVEIVDSNTPPTPATRTTEQSVGAAADLAEGTMKMAKVGERRIAVIRTAAGYHAIDNACPHQGYGLVTGSLVGNLVTCQWHNWKFCIEDGTCVVGEENVASHPVEIRDGQIVVSVTDPTDDERLESLWPSLRSGIAKDYRGQIARDTVRLLDAGAKPADIVWEGIRLGAPKADYGVGHEMANAADCLALVDQFTGSARALPITQALAGIAEETRDRAARLIEPAAGSANRDSSGFAAAVECEDLEGATKLLMEALAGGATVSEIEQLFIEAVGQHHLSYGHGAIYTQKAFELLDRSGWERAADLLPHLLTAIVYGTREDTLPYMRKAMVEIEAVDATALAVAGTRRDPAWSGGAELRRSLLDAGEAPIGAAVEAVAGGAGIEGLLDAVTMAVSERLLRYDLGNEDDLENNFGWLDITHGLTYSRAARWAWQHHRGPASARLALFTVFLCFDTGRAERRLDAVTEMHLPSGRAGDLESAIRDRRADDAVAIALGSDTDTTAQALARASLDDGAGSFIVIAHLVKLARAAAEEAEVIGSRLPLAAAARFAAAPRRERFVSRAVAEAIDFVGSGLPPTR